LESSIDKIGVQLVELIDRRFVSAPGEDKPMNFAMIAPLYALDNISELAWGESFGFMKEGEDMYQWIGIFDKMFPFMVTLAALPSFPWLMRQWPFKLTQPKATDAAGYGRLMG
jgi:hypothetical protein